MPFQEMRVISHLVSSSVGIGGWNVLYFVTAKELKV